MALRILLVLYFLVAVSEAVKSQENIDYRVDDNLLTVDIDDMYANCCSGFISEYHVNYSTGLITITLTDTTAQKCRCNCNFDMTVKIGPFPQGKYSVNVYKEEAVKYGNARDRRILLGKKDVSVYDPHPKSTLKMDFSQSPCKNTSVSNTVDEVLKNGIEIYPNPAAGAVSIKFNLRDNCDLSIKILNFLGKEINDFKFKSLKSGTNTLHLSLNDLPPGLYFGKLNSNTGQTMTFKLMWSK